MQRFAGRGKTIASYLRDFLSPFTPYLLCYSVVPRMVTIEPLWFEIPAGLTSPSAQSLITVEAESSGKVKVSLADGVTAWT